MPYPDLSTKEKAQEFIGLDMKKHNDDKKVFIETVLPVWVKTAGEREKGYDLKNQDWHEQAERGRLTEEAVLDIVEGIFRNNAIRLFRLSI